MLVVRRMGVSIVGVLLMIAVACGLAPTNAVAPTPQPADAVIWGRVPYCNCFAGSATANVAGALQEANLTVSLQEVSPRDGWLYFAVTFDPRSATRDQVGDAIVAGGAEVIDVLP